MKHPPLALKRVRLQNFKAIRDTGWIDFTPLSVFIGNNGSGKSSVIEGLETLRDIARDGLDDAMERWRGFEHIRNNLVLRKLLTVTEKQSQHVALKAGEQYFDHPMAFQVEGTSPREDDFQRFHATMEITSGPGDREIFYLSDLLTQSSPSSREWIGQYLAPGESTLRQEPSPQLWQFLRLNPETMGYPRLMRRTTGRLPLAADGANLAEYLLDIRERDRSAFDGILDALRYILPYAADLQVSATSELERRLYLQMTEGDVKMPGWLLSTGTLRILALLAVLRHPEPPPVVFIEEIENGLDPRTIHLLVEEIQSAIQYGGVQVVLTTHSPYLLDLLPLSSLILCERDETGEPRFYRPTDDESMQRWARDFAPGQLYTMGQFRRK